MILPEFPNLTMPGLGIEIIELIILESNTLTARPHTLLKAEAIVKISQYGAKENFCLHSQNVYTNLL